MSESKSVSQKVLATALVVSCAGFLLSACAARPTANEEPSVLAATPQRTPFKGAVCTSSVGALRNVFTYGLYIGGELHQGSDVVPTREPIPLEVVRK